jgi:translation initiation factor IF-1
MVKNTTGGTGTKGLARKHQVNSGRSELTLPSCELEQIACVTKALGNGMVEIHTNNDVRLIGHIRNKFRGKQKRHNMIGVFSVVLIGLREWENPPKNCDILTIYDSNQIEQLKNIPSIKMNHVAKLSLGNIHTEESKSSASEILFTEDDEKDSFGDLTRGKVREEFKLDVIDQVDFDDI